MSNTTRDLSISEGAELISGLRSAKEDLQNVVRKLYVIREDMRARGRGETFGMDQLIGQVEEAAALSDQEGAGGVDIDAVLHAVMKRTAEANAPLGVGEQ